MNDKLEEYKSNKAKSLGIKGGLPLATFHDGFDAAIALDLPVKFYHYRVACQKKGFPRNENGSLMNVEELYKYWIDNVYTPDL